MPIPSNHKAPEIIEISRALAEEKTTCRFIVKRYVALAEEEGFEPSRRFWRLRDFQSRALDQARRLLQIVNRGHYIMCSGQKQCVRKNLTMAITKRKPPRPCPGAAAFSLKGMDSQAAYSARVTKVHTVSLVSMMIRFWTLGLISSGRV